MTDQPELPPLAERLKQLDEAATSGMWGQFGLCRGPFQEQARAAFGREEIHKIDSSHHMSAVNDGEPKRISEWQHADDAAFAEALVNAYRAGELVPADAMVVKAINIPPPEDRTPISTSRKKREPVITEIERIGITAVEPDAQEVWPYGVFVQGIGGDVELSDTVSIPEAALNPQEASKITPEQAARVLLESDVVFSSVGRNPDINPAAIGTLAEIDKKQNQENAAFRRLLKFIANEEG